MTEEIPLVLRAREGDHDAFQALYDAYFGRIYDFSYQLVRNHDDAADVASDVFLKAVERLRGLKDPAAFKGWLYAIARNASLDLINRRKRTTAIDRAPEPAVSGGLEEHAEQGELRRLVWEAASTLSPRDYSVFELTVRQGLDSGEVAQALGVKPGHAYVLVSRLKDSVEDALGAVVLARAGRRDCAALDGILSQLGDERSPRMRKAVNRHLRTCDDCRSSRKKYASAAALIAGVAHASPADATLQGRVAQNLANLWPTRGPAATALEGSSRLARSVAVPAALAVFTIVAVVQRAAPQEISGLWPVRVQEVASVPAVTESPAPTEEPAAEPDPTPQPTEEPDATRRPRTPSPKPRITPRPTPTRGTVVVVTSRPTTPRPTPTPTRRPTPAPTRAPTMAPTMAPTNPPTNPPKETSPPHPVG